MGSGFFIPFPCLNFFEEKARFKRPNSGFYLAAQSGCR
jgi:hypothetical protein